ncbi:MAG: hypothetical protein F4Y98_05690 [Chloroflexi bacterium]|nr:hypothetical protein [Chloroflexota bacterium]
MFDVFSRRRSEEVLDARDEVSQATRTRLLLLYRDVIDEHRYADHRRIWGQFHNSMEYVHARPVLSRAMAETGFTEPDSLILDLYAFLHECSTEEFLDFIELSFKAEHPPEDQESGTQGVIEAINEILRVDDSPFRLADFVLGEPPRSTGGGPPLPPPIISYPMIIKVEEGLVYSEAVEPALDALSTDQYSVADHEFRKALEHYRDGEFSSSLTDCGSALESVLKVICQEKGWSCDASDTLGALLDNVVPQLGLAPAFKEKFKLLATIRNTYSSSHGGGQTPRDPDRTLTQYMITSTAATIVFLVGVAEDGGS